MPLNGAQYFRRLLPVMFIPPLLCANMLAQGFATVSGTAVDAVSGTPLAHTHVQLTAASAGSSIARYSTESDERGRFSFPHIPPGEYRFWPQETPDYSLLNEVRNDKRVSDLNLKAGDRIENQRLYYARPGTISGRVVDREGYPVQGVQVSADPIQDRRSGLLQSGGSDQTDEYGSYRLRCSPGKYRVSALPLPARDPWSAEVRADGGEGFSNITTFYPHQADEERAGAIEVWPGADTPGVDVRLLGSPAATTELDIAHDARVEGIVVNSVTGEPVGHAHVSLRGSSTRWKGDTMDLAFYAITSADGKFVMKNLTPGDYIAYANSAGFLAGIGFFTTGSVPFVLRDHQLISLSLKVTPEAVIGGRVIDEAGNPPSRLSMEAISDFQGDLLETLFRHHAFGATDEKGQFRLRGLAAGSYRIRAAIDYRGTPPEIREDGRPDDTYGPTYYPGTLSDSSAAWVQAVAGRETDGVEIRLMKAPALHVSGRVMSAPGAPVPTRVELLYSDGPALAGETRPAADGTFIFSRVQPGLYRIIAYGGLPERESRGVPVNVNVGTDSLEGIPLTIPSP
jgi:hypothetical protein